MHELVEAEHLLVVVDPLIERAELDVGNDVIDAFDADGRADRLAQRRRLERGCERAFVARPIEKGVNRFAVGRDGGVTDRSVAACVDIVCRRTKWRCTPSDRGFVDAVDVGDNERDVADPVAVATDVIGDGVVGSEPAGDEEANITLLQEVRHPVAASRLGTSVRNRREAEAGRQEAGERPCIADPPFQVVDAAEPRRRLCVGDCHADAPFELANCPLESRR